MPVLNADKVVASLRGAFAREVGRAELLRTAAERIRAGGPPYTSVYMYMLQGDELVLEAYAGRDTDHTRIPVGKGVCGTAVATGQDQNVPDVRAVWRECARVLAPGGILLAGFFNPDVFIFDADAADLGELVVRHRLPYSDQANLNDDERARLVDESEPFVFSHSLTAQIGGQLDAGFVVTGFYDDVWPDKLVSAYMPAFYATRAVRSAGG